MHAESTFSASPAHPRPLKICQGSDSTSEKQTLGRRQRKISAKNVHPVHPTPCLRERTRFRVGAREPLTSFDGNWATKIIRLVFEVVSRYDVHASVALEWATKII